MWMPRRILARSLGLVLVPCALATGALAADPAPPTGTVNRLFQAFAEDAALVPVQWWEGQLVHVSADPTDETLLNLVAAFQPIRRLEVGGRVGFGRTDSTDGLPDGSGATDLDLWGKWDIGSAGTQLAFAAGGLVTVPTGDDQAGLGHDAFDVEAFGALRYAVPHATLSAHLGVRFNGNGHIEGIPLDGKTSTLLGAGVIVPLSDQVSLVGEANVESERYRGADSDFRLLGGVNWRPFNRGMVRGAIAVGLTNGAPDSVFQLGYAYAF